MKLLKVKHNYNENVVVPGKSGNYRCRKIPKDKVEKVERMLDEIASEKKYEYEVDKENIKMRFRTGLLGEAGIETFFDIEVLEPGAGNSSKYNHPDLEQAGYKVGVKTTRKIRGQERYPLINKNNDYPQLICLIEQRDGDWYCWLCGLATTDVLNTYQDIDDIAYNKDEIVKKGQKTAFWGFRHLKRVSTLRDLNQYRIK